MTTTVGDVIRGSLRLIDQIAEGETPSSDTMADALEVFNELADAWATSRLMMYSRLDQSFTWPASTATRTLGPTGDLVGTRPPELLPDTYYAVGTESFTLSPISQLEYNSLPVKDTTSDYPDLIVVNMTAPNISITLYPIPSQSLTFHAVSMAEIGEKTSLADILYIPNGYRRALRYNLAVSLAAEFGVEPSPTVQRIAAVSMRSIKRTNRKSSDGIMKLPSLLPIVSNRNSILEG